MPPNHFESEVESFLEGSHGDRTHIKRADHHTVTPLCGTLLGCLVCPWAAARPRAVRAARCCLWPHGCSGRRRARPPARSPHASLKARSGRSRGPPWPSGPSGALHTSGACVADVWFGASSRSLARPRRPRGGLQSGGSCAAALTLRHPLILPRQFRMQFPCCYFRI